MTEKEILAVLKIGVEGYSMRDIIDNMTDEEVLEWVSACMDAQTIAGIELALKKAAEHVCMVHHDGRTKFDHNLGYFQNGADNIQVDKNSILMLDSSSILSELKNDIKEG